ncbi:DNA polymerase III subunit delta [Bacillus massilinigeriensis]|uniref:DNA polymerase III subunit delta n=1 Tax=Bacillus mediterraneensis TaxID=1805474 RepID=UPI0008F7E929|nr:DNA polymerase III subunit delta [Bacillus mediterraneensis]
MVLEVWKQLKQKSIKPVYLVYGTESFLISETRQLLIDNTIQEEELDFNLSVYDLEETALDVAMEDAETLPFMGEKRLVILQNPIFLTAEKAKKIEHNLAKLEKYLKEPAPYTVLILLAPYEKLDERKKITKELKRAATVVEAKKLTESELKKWIKERAIANGVDFTNEAVERMLTLAGTNLSLLTSEVDKLALYAGSGAQIGPDIVEKLVSKSLEQNIFSLVDKVVHRRIGEALMIYQDLLKQNEEPLKILSIIAGQFRLIYQVKELSRKGYGQQQIAGTLKVHPFRVKLAAGQASYFTEQELARIITMLAEGDYQMKTGGLRKELIIEMILFKLNRS